MMNLSTAYVDEGAFAPPTAAAKPAAPRVAITFGEPEPVFGTVAGMGRCVVGVRLSGLFPTVPPSISMQHVDQARGALRRAGHDAAPAAIQVEFEYPGLWVNARRRAQPRALRITATIPCKPFVVPKMARAA